MSLQFYKTKDLLKILLEIPPIDAQNTRRAGKLCEFSTNNSLYLGNGKR